ncbi:MAG: propionyl-CoA carboxylase, partial [Polyangiales bacterium]
MAHLPLRPIGAPITTQCGAAEAAARRQAHAARERRLDDARAWARSGWGPTYTERVRAKGKMPSRERVAALADADSRVFEFGTLVHWERRFAGDKQAPAAGVITALVRIQ